MKSQTFCFTQQNNVFVPYSYRPPDGGLFYFRHQEVNQDQWR